MARGHLDYRNRPPSQAHCNGLRQAAAHDRNLSITKEVNARTDLALVYPQDWPKILNAIQAEDFNPRKILNQPSALNLVAARLTPAIPKPQA